MLNNLQWKYKLDTKIDVSVSKFGAKTFFLENSIRIFIEDQLGRQLEYLASEAAIFLPRKSL